MRFRRIYRPSGAIRESAYKPAPLERHALYSFGATGLIERRQGHRTPAIVHISPPLSASLTFAIKSSNSNGLTM